MTWILLLFGMMGVVFADSAEAAKPKQKEVASKERELINAGV